MPIEFVAQRQRPLAVDFLEAIGLTEEEVESELEERRQEQRPAEAQRRHAEQTEQTRLEKQQPEQVVENSGSRCPVPSSSAIPSSSKVAVPAVRSDFQNTLPGFLRISENKLSADLEKRSPMAGSKSWTSGKDEGSIDRVPVETPGTMDHEQALLKSRKESECALQSEDLTPVLHQKKSVVHDSIQSSVTSPPRPGAVGTKRKTPPTQQAPRGQNNGSRPQGPTRIPYHKVPELAELDANMTERGFMNRVWREQVEPRIPREPVTEPWEVRILMDQAHLLDSAKDELFGLVSHSCVRFYAHENGDFLHVGVWVSSTQSQGLHAFGVSQQLVLY